METYKYCQICNEKISVQSNNFYQEILRDRLLYLKCHVHYKKHGKQFLTAKGLIKSILAFAAVWLIAIITYPIWLVTYPFWWIHEQIT